MKKSCLGTFLSAPPTAGVVALVPYSLGDIYIDDGLFGEVEHLKGISRYIASLGDPKASSWIEKTILNNLPPAALAALEKKALFPAVVRSKRSYEELQGGILGVQSFYLSFHRLSHKGTLLTGENWKDVLLKEDNTTITMRQLAHTAVHRIYYTARGSLRWVIFFFTPQPPLHFTFVHIRRGFLVPPTAAEAIKAFSPPFPHSFPFPILFAFSMGNRVKSLSGAEAEIMLQTFRREIEEATSLLIDSANPLDFYEPSSFLLPTSSLSFLVRNARKVWLKTLLRESFI